MSFRADNEKWDRGLHHDLWRANPIFKSAKEPDHGNGSYPFSSVRMRALFSSTGVSSLVDSSGKVKKVEWDERVVYQIEKTAREVLVQRRLDEIWQPKVDQDGTSAIDEIASAITQQCSLELRQRGVRLFACRIVNLEFMTKEDLRRGDPKNVTGTDAGSKPAAAKEDSGESHIAQKQIASWGADWQRQATETRALGQAEADQLMQEARAYAHVALLTAIAQGLRKTRSLYPGIPRNAIAFHFMTALEQLLKQQPEGQSRKEGAEMITSVMNRLPPVNPRE
jgi:hypothetical protein